MNFIKKELFYDTLSQENKVLPYYSKLTNALNNECLFTNETNSEPIKKAISIALCPSFLNYLFSQKDNIILNKVIQNKITGYAILLKEHNSLEAILKSEYKKSFRDNIRRVVNRLETCFDVRYEFYFGDIDKNLYDKLMSNLKSMLVKRFDQRGDSTHVLNNWQRYLESTYTFILQKRASIFVIYANEKIIHVCLNHHFKNILFVSIPSYDINYSKFALGNISIYKLLEWCIENNYVMLDMAYGDFEYKRRWSNYNYTFEHHIISPKNKPQLYILAIIHVFIIKIKNILKGFNVDEFVKKAKSSKQKKSNYQDDIQYTIETKTNINLTDLSKVDHYNLNNDLLLKLIYDFLYNSKLNIKDINVYAHINKKAFIIEGNDSYQNIYFDKSINFLN